MQLYAAPPVLWGRVFDRYALFQSLRRRKGETESEHRARQACWLRSRRSQKRELGLGDTQRPDESTNLGGAWIASPDHVAGSDLELLLEISPTARALVIDVAADKDWMLAQISDLIDRERAAHRIVSLPRRGPDKLETEKPPEFREFLQTVRKHHIVPLWDLQLAGLSTGKLATARVLYKIADKRSLLAKLRRARELQEEALSWIPRLTATV